MTNSALNRYPGAFGFKESFPSVTRNVSPRFNSQNGKNFDDHQPRCKAEPQSLPIAPFGAILREDGISRQHLHDILSEKKPLPPAARNGSLTRSI